jgi:hypothetical protein
LIVAPPRRASRSRVSGVVQNQPFGFFFKASPASAGSACLGQVVASRLDALKMIHKIFARIGLVFTGHWEDKHVYELPSIFALL